LIIFNGINHIKLVTITEKGHLPKAYEQARKYLDFISSKIDIEFDDVFGYITCKPLNCGTALELRLLFEELTPLEINDYKSYAENSDLASYQILNSSVEIWNKNKVALSIDEIFSHFINFNKRIEIKK
jgi:protein-arginine kinase